MTPPIAFVAAAALLAQTPVPSGAEAVRPQVTFAVERRLEHVRYRFDHPSNFDTVDLVPHFFEQRYDARATWLHVTARYRLFGAPAWTDAGVTPIRTTAGSDIDTFFDPSGDVITSGTDDRVRLRAFSLDQRIGIAQRRGWTIGIALGYRSSRADFLPADIIVTHSQPASVTSTFTTTRETTRSHVFQSGLMAETSHAWPRGWRLTLSGEALPIVRARLITSLPDKFATDVVNQAFSFGIEGRAEIERRWSCVSAGVSFSGSGTWGYRRTSAYAARSWSVGAFMRVGG